MALPEKPHIVKDYYIGNTHVLIADNYCAGKTKDEVEAVLKRIAEIADKYIGANAVNDE